MKKMKLSDGKSSASVFTTWSKEAKFDPYLTMNNSPTPVKSKVKVLGVILDSKLIIGEYIRSTPEKLPKSNNILKKIVGNNWGCSDEKL